MFVGACLSDRAYCNGIGGEKGGWWVPRVHKVVCEPLIGARLARMGVHMHMKVGKMESECGGHIESIPPIGIMGPLGPVCGEKSSK